VKKKIAAFKKQSEAAAAAEIDEQSKARTRK
jgi:hypothetical protein